MTMTKFLTPEGFKKIEKELKELKQTRRREIAKKLEKAIAFGDLSENAEYAAAKEEQAFIEGRILELEDLIANAEKISKQTQTDWVQVGSTILVSSKDGEEKFQIVGAQESSPIEGKISAESPLGMAFLNKPKGAAVKIQTPEGETQYKILKIE